MTQQYHVYGMGNALLDMEYEVQEQFLQQWGIGKGVMTLLDRDSQHELMHALGDIPDHRLACGGSAANTMMVLQYLGAQGFYTCKIANDKAGDFYYKDMKKAGLANNFDLQARKPGYTGRCVAMLTCDADRTMNTCLGISETLSTEELHEPALANSQFLYIEGYLVTSATAFAAVRQAYSLAKSHQVQVAISLSDPFIVNNFKAQFDQILTLGVDLLFCNEAEAKSYTGCDDLDQAAEALQQVAKRFIITCGPKGSLLYDGSHYIKIEGEPVRAIDTLGAGDMYAGAFLAGITKHGLDFEAAGMLANSISAQIVTQFGPRVSPEQAEQSLAQVMAHVLAPCREVG